MSYLGTKGNKLPDGIMYDRTYLINRNIQNWTSLVILESLLFFNSFFTVFILKTEGYVLQPRARRRYPFLSV